MAGVRIASTSTTAGVRIASTSTTAGVRSPARPLSTVRTGLLGLATVLAGAIVSYLVTAGLWFVAVALLMLLPAFVVLHRVPLAGIAVWLVVAPFITDIGGGIRLMYWAVHRGLPVVALAILITSGLLGIRTRPLARLGWPELMMAGYVGVTVLSILYTSGEAMAALFEVYDRVVVPMCLYLLVRLLRPTDKELRWSVPIVVFVLLTQTAIGALSWIAPATLPDEWLKRLGERTTGSLISPSVFGVTTIAAALLLTHAAAYERRRGTRMALLAMSLLGFTLSVFTFTRAVWIAAAVAVVALAVAHRRQLTQLAFVTVPVVALLVTTGALSGQLSTLESRLNNESTVFDRLPVAIASVRMLEERPLTGFGYGNFEAYDREFQPQVNDFVPEIDHASHNLYLTLLAEQGLPGAALFVGPAIWWLLVSIDAWPRMGRSGFSGRRLLVLLWAVLAGHFAVNNFSNMGSVVGLGQWWLVLGLIASLVADRSSDGPGVRRPGPLPDRRTVA